MYSKLLGSVLLFSWCCYKRIYPKGNTSPCGLMWKMERAGPSADVAGSASLKLQALFMLTWCSTWQVVGNIYSSRPQTGGCGSYNVGISLVKGKLLMLVFGSEGCRRKDFHKSRSPPVETGDHQYAPIVPGRAKKKRNWEQERVWGALSSFRNWWRCSVCGMQSPCALVLITEQCKYEIWLDFHSSAARGLLLSFHIIFR